MEKRQDWLDIAKGLGIIMVVWAHAEGPFSDYITQFHMPFFFFIAGILHHSTKYTNADYVKHKVRRLLFPFWKWNIIFYPLFFLLFYWGKWSSAVFLNGIKNITLTLDKVPFLGATWFLASLFWVSCFFQIVVQFIKGGGTYVGE